LCVLVYHRIADDRANDWTTSTREFLRQMTWLERHFEMISLAEVRQRMSQPNVRPAVAVTFDDGYAINCETALPFLVERGIPCTYFVTSRNVIEGVPFPHDLAMGNSLAPNTVAELKKFAAQGIEIGAHTRTHPDIGAIHHLDVLHEELVTSRHDLQEALELPIPYFAFPFGQPANLNADAVRITREAGYEAICSAYCPYNFPGDDPFHVQRMCVDGPFARMRNWVTVDPLRLLRTRNAVPSYLQLKLPEYACASVTADAADNS
jgi:peptidoglycan/xylan/chitin deacetylase (PgdA/CDA1 family)